MADFHDLWAEAVTVYEKQTDRKIDKDNTFRTFDSLQDLEVALDDEKGRFDDFRSKHQVALSKLSKCIAPMQPILLVIQKSLGNTPYAPACAVFGAASYLLQACTAVSKAYDGIEELFEQLSSITVRLKEYEYTSVESSLRSKITDILAYLLEIIGKAEACIKRRRFKQWARSVFLQEDEIGSSLTKLQRYVETELGLVIALTYGRVKDLQDTTDETRSQVSVVKTGVNEILTNQRTDRQRAFSEADEKKLVDGLKTKSTDEIAREHAKNVESLTKGTGLWIREDVMFQAWEQEKAPILWVFGKPGVGKTMLAARTIEMLQNKYPQHSDIPSLTSVSYMYFKDDKPDLQDCAQLWKAAALQIAKANDRFKKHILATIDKKQDTFASARRIWQQLFLDFFTEDVSSKSLTSLAFIIVDGLDEGPEAERVKFLKCLAELVAQSTSEHKCRIQLAVFARPDVRADPGFENVGFRRQERIIQVTPERNIVDIEAFIRQRLSDVEVLKMLKKRKAIKEYQTLAKQIYTSIQSRSQGMFLWASLVFDQIRDSPSPEAIRESLKEAPRGLDEMLHHVFTRLDVEEQMHRSYLSDLLSWVFCTYRPLSIAELFVLLRITANQHCYMLEDHLRARYGSLFDMLGIADESDCDSEDAEGETEATVKTDEDDSKVDDFDFLDKPGSSDIDEDENDEACSEGSAEEDQELRTTAAAKVTSDDENTFEMPYRWYRNTVTFSHARIRDYLTTEGHPPTRRWRDCSVVPENIHMTRQLIFLACIQILRTDIAEKHGVWTLKEYAKVNWIKHFVEVDFSFVSKSSEVMAATTLAKLFYNGTFLLNSAEEVWNQFIETWFCTSRYSSLVRKIITDHITELDGDERVWASSIKESARNLFRPLVVACSKKWLTKTGWDDGGYLNKSERQVWILYAFSKLGDEGSTIASEDSFNVFSGMWNIPLDSIESIANLEQLPKTEHWYAGVAWIMMEADEADYTQRAIEYFKKALELKPGGWMAMEGLARCYGENLHQYETAIRWMEDGIRCLPDDFSGIAFYLQTRISDWKLHLGNDEDSVGIARTSYEGSRDFIYGTGTASDDSILRSVKHYLEALYRTQRYNDIVDLIYELDGRDTILVKDNLTEAAPKLWIVFLRAQYDDFFNASAFDKMGKVMKETKNERLLKFMKKSIDETPNLTADTVSDSRSVWLAMEGAEWLYHYATQPEDSIELWTKVVTLVDQSNEVVQQSHAWYRTRAAGFLGMMYFNSAKTAHRNGEDYSKDIAKLENLAKHKQGSKRYYRASYPAHILGLWLHEYEHADEQAWKECIRPSIKQGLYLLSDEDPWNDQSAYAQLGKALLAAGDIFNASIALGVTTKPLEEVRRSKSSPVDDEKPSQHDESDGELIPEGAGLDKLRTSVETYVPNIEAMAAHQGDHDNIVSSTNMATGPASSTTEGGASAPSEAQQVAVASDEEVASATVENEDKSCQEHTQDVDEEEEEGSVASINPKYAGFHTMWRCDGPCARGMDAYAELHFCRVCNDLCFCEDCIALVKNDTMPYRYCAADHPHVKVFPMTDEAVRLADALVERRFEVQQEWLAGLRKTWDA